MTLISPALFKMVRRNQLRPTLHLTTSQRLAMTPSLLQKIELLTLNQLELSELMTQEMVENPFLEERVGGEGDEGQQESEKESAVESDTENENEAQLSDAEFEYFFGESTAAAPRGYQYEDQSDRPGFELFLATTTSLSDHLTWQLDLEEFDPGLRSIAEFIIGNLNEDGYLQVSIEEIADRLGVDLGDAERALELVQSFDPAGVGARDIRECLLIQLRAAELAGTFAERLVAGQLDKLEKRKFKEMARELSCSVDEVVEALEVIRRFSPSPGQKYNARQPAYIKPDVYIQKVDDDYEVMLNDDGMPRLRLNRGYRAMLLRNDAVSKDAKSYVKERFRSALELLRSIDQRQQTIYRVCHAIIRRQTEFLEKGKLLLKPMLIKDIAEELEVHPSTISRVVANKYAHTPQGVIELRKFFTVGVENSNGEAVSTVHVKEKIKKIIENEDSSKPLSDQKISKLLSQGGIQITRRTVAKYRDQMKIAGSRERKRPHL